MNGDLLPRRPPLRTGWQDGLILLSLGALILGIYWPVWAGDPTAEAAFAPGDLTVYYYPLAAYTVQQLWQGRLPLWNPYVLGGFPHLAEPQTQLLYPSSWLTAVLTLGAPLSYRAFAGSIVAHLILAAWGAYGFFRWLVRDRAAGAFGGVAWGLSGYLTGYPLQAPTILATAAWLPWLLWTAGRALLSERSRRQNAAVAAFIWAMITWAGFPQTALYVYGASVAFGVACVLAQPASQRRQAWGTGLLIGMGGVLLSLPQVLPSVELAWHSDRLEMPFPSRATGFEIWELWGLLWPHITSWSPLYVGMPTLLAAALLSGGNPRGPRGTGLWIGIGSAGVLLSLGQESAWFPILVRMIPILELFRNQERAAILVAWSLVTLGTLGWGGVVQPDRRRLAGLLLGIWGGLLAGFLLWIQAQPVAEWPRLHRLFSDALWAWMMGGLAWLLVGRWPSARGWLVALLALDLGSVAWRTAIRVHWVWAPPDQISRPPISGEWIPERARGHRIDTRGHITGNWTAVMGLQDLHGHLSLVSRAFLRFRAEVPGERVWGLMGVGCYIRHEDEPTIPFPSEWIASLDLNRKLRLECLHHPFPRYRLVYESIAFDDETAIRAMKDERFDPFRTVILDRPWPLPPAALPLSPELRILSEAPEEIRLWIQTPRPGFLVVGDPWYPGWEAEVDGQPAPVLRAYVALRAVPLPAGTHMVRLHYRPLTLLLGAFLALFAAAALGMWALWPWLRAFRLSKPSRGRGSGVGIL